MTPPLSPLTHTHTNTQATDVAFKDQTVQILVTLQHAIAASVVLYVHLNSCQLNTETGVTRFVTIEKQLKCKYRHWFAV